MMTVDQMIEVLTAYKAGKKIQYLEYGLWKDCGPWPIGWDFANLTYRVKPEPKVTWVNECDDGSGMMYLSEERAKLASRDYHARIAVRYVEMPEEGAS